MWKIGILAGLAIGIAGCSQEEKVSTSEKRLDVYASTREAKVIRLYVDDDLVTTITDDGDGTPTYSPLLTLPGTLAFAVAMCAQGIPEYDADLRYYTTGP